MLMTTMQVKLPNNQFLDLTIPAIMGIINITPDSFWQASRQQTMDDILRAADNMVEEGASIIDLGGEPTNPLASGQPSEQEEIDRVIPAVEALKKHFDAIISIDTSRPAVMKAAIASRIDMINDVRALQWPGALEALRNSDVAVCLMHMSFPFGMQAEDPLAIDPVGTVKRFLHDRVAACEAIGIDKSRLIIDPGFGTGIFKKTVEQNFQLLKQLAEFQTLGCPLLIGVSRKTFIRYTLERDIADSLIGSIAVTAYGLQYGANIVRTHDVAATLDTIKMITQIQGA